MKLNREVNGMVFKTKLLLKPEDFKPSFNDWEIKGVLNPAAIRLPNKKIMLYVRIAESAMQRDSTTVCPIMSSEKEYSFNYQHIHEKDIVRRGRWGEMYLKDGLCRLPTISHFKKVVLSSDGFKVEEIEQTPIFTGIPGDGEYGVEDPRIVKLERKYVVTYVTVSTNEGVSTSLAFSNDLKNWKRQGIIFREQNKDVVIFPEKINGFYVALHRPEGFFEFSKPNIWISYSKDLIYWGRERSILQTRSGWDKDRVGAGAPPIKTKKGWLVIYHGAVHEENNHIYCAGAVLLDLKNPERVLARTPKNKPLIKPLEKFEKKGFIDNVVFPTGAVVGLNGKELLIYAGGADRFVSVRKIKLSDILKSLEFY